MIKSYCFKLMILSNNNYNNFLQQTNNNNLLNKCLVIVSNTNSFIDICHDIIDNIGNTDVYCVRLGDYEYSNYLNKKIIVIVDNPDNHYDLIYNIINREMVLYRKKGDYRITQINPTCNVIIFTNNLNISQQIKDISIIITTDR